MLSEWPNATEISKRRLKGIYKGSIYWSFCILIFNIINHILKTNPGYSALFFKFMLVILVVIFIGFTGIYTWNIVNYGTDYKKDMLLTDFVNITLIYIGSIFIRMSLNYLQNYIANSYNTYLVEQRFDI